MVKKKDYKAPLLTPEAAVERLEGMLPMLVENIYLTMALDAALSTGNKEILKLNSEYSGSMQWYGAHLYNTVCNSLVTSLCLVIARLFDQGSGSFHPDKRDTLSIPILVYHLKKEAVRSILVQRAKTWPVDDSEIVKQRCRDCISLFANLEIDPQGLQVLNSLKDFRDKRLAHTLDKEFVAPRFQDLTLLRNVAMKIGAHASLIVEGKHWEPSDFFEERVRQGNAFWPPAIRAVLVSEQAH
jgi:hypothetical protein